MLNSKNKTHGIISRLKRFIYTNLLYIPILLILVLLVTYATQLIYNNQFSITNNTVVEGDKVPRIIQRTTLASRGDVDRGDRVKVASSPVVTSTPTSIPTIIPNSTPTVQSTVVPTITSTVKSTVKPKVKDKSDNVGFKYVDSFRGTITKYTLDPRECSKNPGNKGYGITASGTRVKQGRTIATGSNIEFGSIIKIEGIEGTFRAEDTGNGVGKYGIDIYATSRSEALKFGRQSRIVYIISKGTGKIK